MAAVLTLHTTESRHVARARYQVRGTDIRAAGPMDVLIAAYTIENNAIGSAADHDFEHIVQVANLPHEYIRPTS